MRQYEEANLPRAARQRARDETKTNTPEDESDPLETELHNYISARYDSSLPWDPKWWRAHEARFPHVALLARCLQAIPATSATSERFFSVAGIVITPLRNRLAADRIEKLASCVQFDLQCMIPTACDVSSLIVASSVPHQTPRSMS